MKIAIIGAGASGLSAANYLKKLGYHDVTVYEKNSYVGGKVFSYTYKDKMYDLGAIILGKKDNYKISHEILTRFNIPLEEFVTPEILYMDGRQIAFEDYLKENYTVLNTLKAAIFFVRLYFKFRGYFRKGFIHASPELFISFEDFVHKHKIESFADTLKPFFVGCGYGYYEDVPTIYLLRMLFWFVRSRLRLKGMIRTISGNKEMDIKTCKNGCQELWIAMAKELHVETNALIESIKRHESGPVIEIVVNGKKRTFDRLIISSPLDETVQYMDVSDEEKDLFCKIEYSNYFVTLFLGEGFDKTYFIRDHVHPSKIGKTVAICRRHPEENVFMGYQIAPWEAKPDDVLETLKEDITHLGGKIEEIITQKQWRYFPRLNTQNLKDGYYQRLDKLQGQKGTYYIGAVMNFETVENTIDFAQKLVKKYFS